jgi:hypothetical protein
VLGDEVHAVYLDSIGVHADVLVDFVALAVVYDGGFTRGHHIAQVNLRSGGQDALIRAHEGTDTPYADPDDSGQGKLYQSQRELAPQFCCLRVKCPLLGTDTSFSIVHLIRLSADTLWKGWVRIRIFNSLYQKVLCK